MAVGRERRRRVRSAHRSQNLGPIGRRNPSGLDRRYKTPVRPSLDRSIHRRKTRWLHAGPTRRKRMAFAPRKHVPRIEQARRTNYKHLRSKGFSHSVADSGARVAVGMKKASLSGPAIYGRRAALHKRKSTKRVAVGVAAVGVGVAGHRVVKHRRAKTAAKGKSGSRGRQRRDKRGRFA